MKFWMAKKMPLKHTLETHTRVYVYIYIFKHRYFDICGYNLQFLYQNTFTYNL